MASNEPTFKNIVKARYGYEIKAYVGTSGDFIFSGKDFGRITSFIKSDNPTAKDLVFPEARLKISVNSDERRLIQKNMNDIIIILSLTVKYEKIQEDRTSKIMSESVLWDRKFQCVVLTKDDMSMDTEDNEAVKKNDDGSYSAPSADMVQKFSSIEMLISCIEHRNRMKIPLNFNLADKSTDDTVTIADTIAYALSQLNLPDKSVIFQQPDRTEKYKQVFTPIWNFKDFCKHMQTVYGIYKPGLIIYQDFDYLYIIPYTSDNYAVPEKQHNQVHIYHYGNEVAGASPQIIGMYKDDDASRYVIVQPKSYTFTSVEEFMKETVGNKFKVFDNKQAEKAITYEGETFGFTKPLTEYNTENTGNKNADDKIRYVANELSNDYLNSERATQLKMSSKVLLSEVTDVDISILNFNKTYKVYFKDDDKIDAKYGGTYKLLMVGHALHGQGKEPVVSKSKLFLLKV